MNHDKLQEKKISYFKNGDKNEGKFKDDEFHGNRIFHFVSGNRYEGEFKDVKFNGNGIFYFINGDRYEGEFKDGKFNGNGIFYFSNGVKYEGEYKDSKRHGNGTYCTKNGEEFFGEWYQNKMIFLKEEKGSLKGFTKLCAALNYKNVIHEGFQPAVAVDWLKKRFEDEKEFGADHIFLTTKKVSIRFFISNN